MQLKKKGGGERLQCWKIIRNYILMPAGTSQISTTPPLYWPSKSDVEGKAYPSMGGGLGVGGWGVGGSNISHPEIPFLIVEPLTGSTEMFSTACQQDGGGSQDKTCFHWRRKGENKLIPLCLLSLWPDVCLPRAEEWVDVLAGRVISLEVVSEPTHPVFASNSFYG